MFKLSIIVPAYNEKNTIAEILKRAEGADVGESQKEIVVVDDGSSDGTREVLKHLEKTGKYRILYQDKNKGKGAALRRGFQEALGDFIIVQDADLEYDPNEYKILLAPLLDGRADVVFGSRFMGASAHRVLFFWHYVGNKILTTLSNIFTDLNLTDMETGYKAFRRTALLKILPKLKSSRFGIEPEIVARVAKAELRVYEVGISYSGRTYAEGKKIGWRDGLYAISAIIRFNLFD
ncbi:glycosyl transferase [Candidatus Giovannonibacteria bacterium RIFCSPHIGHO2_01_FULL_45_24]|uniref:Glycosyl transferase n=1 Tax=Candidatus Giovannonibacteria bacterium RIFCSPLOWO2_01_FULL_46_32 TaxID=1798353 RepID=A0A1F5XGT7_9BACT|nr:MAG: glycosyl transferase [Candidatus Giovannonibacteria bacterium RIFCSPHIGHO2_01_FULL_45_24]OGF87079.1 MAG: glycosyl transferase [Candidatus Giovannonibacteria bacterium RIFCSPLOWO2_01_FULL_46_32]